MATDATAPNLPTKLAPNLPTELWYRIVACDIFGFPLLPSQTENLANDLKFLSEDCELAAKYDQNLVRLSSVCSQWRAIVNRIAPIPSHCNRWLVLEGVTDPPPSASRVHFRNRLVPCECKSPRCRINTPLTVGKTNDTPPVTLLSKPHLEEEYSGVPPLFAYQSNNTPTEAVISSISILPPEAIAPILIGTVKPHLRLVAAAVDFSCGSPFSLPALSVTCPNLTHLNLSDLYLPDGPTDQTLDLPHLTTLVLDFNYPETSPPGATTAIHRSVSKWNLPVLRHLGLKGWIDDETSPLFNDISNLIQREGPKLDGLLYNVWTRSSSTGNSTPCRLPPEFWGWCPELHSIQIPLIVLFAKGPQAAMGRRLKLSVIPVCHGDLTFLRDIGALLWPMELIHRLPHPSEWPIEKFCASSTWPTFHRKLLRYHSDSMSRRWWEKEEDGPGYWRGYFREWIHKVSVQGYVLEDRYGVDIHQGAGQALLRWLSGDDSAAGTLEPSR